MPETEAAKESLQSPNAATVLNAIPDAVLLAGADGMILMANAGAAELVNALPEDLQGQTLETWQARFAAFVTALEGSGDGLQRWETRRYPRRVVESWAAPVGHDGATLLGYRDVTDSVRRDQATARHERQMAELQGRLDQVERYKLELTANVTHDLRTPLASIKASISGLLAGDITYDPSDVRETLTLVEEECDRLQRRVTNLLSMARMESGDAQLGDDWVDLADMTQSALESLRSVRAGRQVRLDFPEELPLVRADYDQLQIAIRNLIENAFNYSPADQPVDVSASTGLGSVRVRVRDYGNGLMPDEFERVFDKFYRGRSARRIPGTGIGLPICRGIAEAHGGRLWAEHVPGGGVQFVLSLPLSEEGEVDLASQDYVANPAQPPSPTEAKP